jgi:Type IV secretion system pilin
MRKIKRLLLGVALFSLSFGAFYVNTTPVYADAKDAVCNGVNSVVEGSGCNNGEASENKVISLANTALGVFSWIIGVAAVFAIIYAGLQFMIANGDASKIAKAKNTILYAIVGLVIVALAQVIVRFVITST